jgi:hypothetical protein
MNMNQAWLECALFPEFEDIETGRKPCQEQENGPIPLIVLVARPTSSKENTIVKSWIEENFSAMYITAVCALWMEM